jgi:hypothetical protein
MLSLPFLELHGIELLELVSLSLTIKCDRCKTAVDVPNIKNSSGDSSGIRSESCRKCANALDIGNNSISSSTIKRTRLSRLSRLSHGPDARQLRTCRVHRSRRMHSSRSASQQLYSDVRRVLYSASIARYCLRQRRIVCADILSGVPSPDE